MTDETVVQGEQAAAETPAATQVENPPAAADPAKESIAALEARLTELENVVHAVAHIADPSAHGVVLPWLEKIGARIKAAVEKVL